HFRVAAVLVDGFLRAGDLSDLAEDLRVVPKTHGRNRGIGRRLITLNLRIVGRSVEGIRLPLVLRRDRLDLLDARGKRRLGRADVEDEIGNIFLVADRLVRLKCSARNGHNGSLRDASRRCYLRRSFITATASSGSPVL